MPHPPNVITDAWFQSRCKWTESGCWEWTLGKRRHGYGATQIKGVSRIAHRVAWEFYKGAIPEGLNVCHKCDNPPCCNPDHLYLGTALDNSRDMFAHGRGFNIGKTSRWLLAKITAEQVAEIRRLYSDGVYTQDELGGLFGLCQSAVSRITTRNNWKDIA